jgi:CRP/FNR family transcriptional regulator
MIAAFENYLRLQTDLSQDDISRISTLAVTRKLRRNEFLLREGDICRHKIFIASGILRLYGLAPDGSEHILQFAPESSWTLDVESYDREVPAHTNIVAVEPSEVLLWPKADFTKLVDEIPQLKNFSQQLISRNIYNSRQRLLTTLGGTPEQKYEDFVQNSPGLLSRLPLWMIASYLGISLKTLTRIRHAQLQR